MRDFFAIFFAATLGVSALSWASDAGFDPAEATANGRYQIAGNWSELKHGWNDLRLRIVDFKQRPVIGTKVAVDYEMKEMPMNAPVKPVEDLGDGIYKKRIFLGMPGTWKFDAQVGEGGVEDTLSHLQRVMN